MDTINWLKIRNIAGTVIKCTNFCTSLFAKKPKLRWDEIFWSKSERGTNRSDIECFTTVKESFLPLLQSQERTVAEMVDPKMLLVLNNSNKVDWVSQ